MPESENVLTPPNRSSRWRSMLDVVTTVALLASAIVVLQRYWTSSPEGNSRNDRPLPTEPVSLDSLPTLGSPNAEVALIIYSDFHCPYCISFARDDFPKVLRRFVHSGDVLVAFANFPLTRIHPSAADAAIAADCAHRQGKFWPFHDAMFGESGLLNAAALTRHVGSAGLDPSAFQPCFADPQRSARVARFVEAARQIGADGTPTFLIRKRVGQTVQATGRLRGSVEFEVLSDALEQAIRTNQNQARRLPTGEKQ